MIIGITGKARSGKDQLGAYIQDIFNKKHDRWFTHIFFAEMLKTMCMDHFDLSNDQVYGDLKEVSDNRYVKELPEEGTVLTDENFWTPREILQELGSFYRKIDHNFWVRILQDEIKVRGIKDALITDVRHINEAEFVKNSKGMLLKITRDDVSEIHNSSHISETALDDYKDFDIIVPNKGTLQDLENIASEVVVAIIELEKLINNGGIYNG